MLPLQDHPFPVRAHFASSLVVTFGVPLDRVRPLLPPFLTPDTFRDETAFIAVALVDTRHLRPAALPKLFGQDFFLIGYRVFVRYRNRAGRNLRGLYILRSETNRRRMQWLGNLFTHYGYTTTDIQQRQDGDRLSIRSLRSDLDVRVDTSEENPPLPPDSCFANWKEARRFATSCASTGISTRWPPGWSLRVRARYGGFPSIGGYMQLGWRGWCWGLP